jgi:hypothetical protein
VPEVHDKSCRNFDVQLVAVDHAVFTSTQVKYSETCEWGNSVLAVLWEAWKEAVPFKRLVLEEIYLAINVNRPQFLSEI